MENETLLSSAFKSLENAKSKPHVTGAGIALGQVEIQSAEACCQIAVPCAGGNPATEEVFG